MEYVTSIERRGIRKGQQQGGAGILLRLLQSRFGALDEATEAHIRALSLEQLEELSDALLGFAARSDLENWLSQHPLPSTLSGAGEAGNGATIES